MSKQFDRINIEADLRMKKLNHERKLGNYKKGSPEWELNELLWREAFERFTAAWNAKFQSLRIRHTTKGDFSHLQSTGSVHF